MLTRSLLLALALVACGGGQPTPATPAPASITAPVASASAAPEASPAPQTDAGPVVASASDGGSPAAKSWNDMNHEERLALMKTAVFPKMKDAFQGFDAKRFADFTCKTCHGEGVKQGKFDMPNPKLPKLDASNGFKKAGAKHGEIMKFMAHTVVPGMAETLGLPKWDGTKGFGCASCHVME